MTAAQLFQTIAGTTFYYPKPDEDNLIKELRDKKLIQPVQQGKLYGFALAPAGYAIWIGHR
jgi:hypothetical protein